MGLLKIGKLRQNMVRIKNGIRVCKCKLCLTNLQNKQIFDKCERALFINTTIISALLYDVFL